jgi:endonuclease/exonuclease/phosphatase family metal-dependent hydrolase
MVFTAVSYNIHQCVGMDGRRDPQRVAEVIRELNADVVGLQEVDFRPLGLKKSYQLNYLAEATGLHAIAGPTIRRVDAEFGNALLTRLEIGKVRLHDLSVPGRQPRGAIDAEIFCQGKAIRVVVTHLGLGIRERRRQVHSLLEVLRESPAECTFLLGDINEWRPRSFAIRSLDTCLGRIACPRTFPATYPVFPLDRIWASPPAGLLDLKVPRNGLARLASDHLPIWASFDLSNSLLPPPK